MNKNKRVVVIGTGGTIAGVGQEGKTGNYTSAQIKVEALVEEIPNLDSLTHVESVNMFDVDSSDITFDNLLEIAKYINKTEKDENIQGFVVTQGTDTLEESAYFLNLTVKTEKPVVVTGSMRPNTAISADGPLNLYQSIALAKNEEAKGKGVLTVFCDGIYSAREVRKINTFRVDAFNQRDLGLGYMRDDKVYFYNSPLKLHTLKTEFDISNISKFPKVDIITFYMDASPEILDFAADHADGLVIAGAGCGGTSTAWNNKITKLLEKNYPIVRSSRIGNGLITFDEGELFTSGIGSNNLTPEKSRILLSLAISKTRNIYEIQDIFNKY